MATGKHRRKEARVCSHRIGFPGWGETPFLCWMDIFGNVSSFASFTKDTEKKPCCCAARKRSVHDSTSYGRYNQRYTLSLTLADSRPSPPRPFLVDGEREEQSESCASIPLYIMCGQIQIISTTLHSPPEQYE